MAGCWSGLWVEVEVLDDGWISTPVVFKDLGWCLTLPAALCRLIVVVGVICSLTWRVSIWLLSLGVSVVCFDTGGASNGPTEAINGIVELCRGAASGCRNPTTDSLRMLLIAVGLDASTHT